MVPICLIFIYTSYPLNTTSYGSTLIIAISIVPTLINSLLFEILTSLARTKLILAYNIDHIDILNPYNL